MSLWNKTRELSSDHPTSCTVIGEDCNGKTEQWSLGTDEAKSNQTVDFKDGQYAAERPRQI